MESRPTRPRPALLYASIVFRGNLAVLRDSDHRTLRTVIFDRTSLDSRDLAIALLRDGARALGYDTVSPTRRAG